MSVDKSKVLIQVQDLKKAFGSNQVLDCRLLTPGQRPDRATAVLAVDRDFRAGERLDDFQHRRAVIGHILFEDKLFLARRRVRQRRTFDADPFDQTFRLHGFGVHIDQLIFDRRAAGVNDQDICHTTFLP